MARKIPRAVWLAGLLAYFLYFFRLSGAGLMGPDEPRYAWIGRAMAQSGDWITPRLWGQPWFEKPALLYWMTAAAFRAGLGPDLAPRLPVAIIGTFFLAFYWWILNREFGCRPALFATMILGSSVAWLGFSQAAVPDLPLTATFSAAMLLVLPWIRKRQTGFLPSASALLGLAVLAKGLVPLALAAPLALRVRWFRDLLRPRVLAPFFLIALPWYALCYWRNGPAFLEEFFVRHHLSRFASGELLHRQPWWFYLARLPLLLLPWTPLAALLFRGRRWYQEPRRLFLLIWILAGLAIFSASVNKLPGYVLPLVPAIAALAGLALDELPDARFWLAAAAALLAAFPVAAPIVPAAVANEWSAAPRPAFAWLWLAPVAAAAVWYLEARARRIAAVLLVTAGTAAGFVYLKVSAQPELERIATARGLARRVAQSGVPVCLGAVRRDWEYGLTYYLGARVPSCDANSSPMLILQEPGHPPELTPPRPPNGTGTGHGPVDRPPAAY